MKCLRQLLLLSQLLQACLSFTIGSHSAACREPTNHESLIVRRSASTDTSELKLSESEQNVYGLLEEFHASKFDFRVVVVGNGAILETTAPLGPKMQISESPATPGQHLVTFASEDASFEFHVKIGQVSKVAMVEKLVSETKTLRILRMTNDGKPLCSLILTDQSSDATEWFQSMMEKYGSETEF